jgi:hypothetical protein
MRWRKKLLSAVLVVFIAIQFIRPARNNSGRVLLTDISKLVSIPDSVQAILKNVCYDCHSNNTNYPWYVNIQPMGWLMAKHIKKGKAGLNFSEFGSYSTRRQISKLTGIANSVKDGIMPLASYKWLHRNARLDKDEKIIIINWVQQAKDSFSAKSKREDE